MRIGRNRSRSLSVGVALVVAVAYTTTLMALPSAGAVAGPVVSAPVAQFPAIGTTVPQKDTGSVYEIITWRLIDPGSSGFSHYVLEQFNTYANSWGVVYYGTGTSFPTLLPAVQFTEFRVTAYDGGGQPGATRYGQGLVPVIADDSDKSDPYASPMTFSGGWSRVFAATAFGGSSLRSTKAGAKYKMCGFFTQFAVVGRRSAVSGSAAVVAFGTASIVSYFSQETRYREVVGRWSTRSTNGIPAGGGPSYCVSLVASSSKQISVDAVEYNVPDIIE